MSWPTKKLGEVCEIIAGQAPPSKFYNKEGRGTPFLRINSFGEIYPKVDAWTTKCLKESSRGDILFSVAGSLGFVNLGVDACITRSIFALRPRNTIIQKFLFHFLKLKGQEFGKSGRGSAQKIVTKKQVENLEIPLPPIKIQKRIVARIEELFEKIDKARELRQKAQEETEQIFQSALQEIFSKAEKKREVKRLGEIIELHYGKGIPQTDRKVDGKYPIYGANGELGRTDKYLVEGEAIIIGRKGTAGAVNRVSGQFWPADVTYYVFGNKKIDIDFLFYAFNKIDLSQLAIGIKPGINRNKVYELRIPLPPPSEQKKIVAYFDGLREKVEKLKQLQQNQSEELTELKQSILDKAFKGE